MGLRKISYGDLNGKQKELFNFQKVSAVLADYGFVTIWLTDDWMGADFLAKHCDGFTLLHVQLKGRLTFDKKYIGKGLMITFPYKGVWYMYDHDELMSELVSVGMMAGTSSWDERGQYSWNSISGRLLDRLERWKL